ncbi:ATP-binding protein [Thermodesulfobacteriota bacterium]
MQNKKVLFIIPKSKGYDSVKKLAGKIDAPIDIENDASIAYDMLKSGCYALVVSTMFSNKINGYELLTRLKEDKINCGVILIMGGRREKVKQELVDAGVFSFVKKVEDETEISEQIKDFFKKSPDLKKFKAYELEPKSFEYENRICELEQELLENKTHLKCLENELQAANKRNEAAKKQLTRKRNFLINHERMISMGQMIASIIHEMNNPLTVVTSLASAISLESKNNKIIAKYNTMLEANIDKLRKFTSSILSYANPVRAESAISLQVNIAIDDLLDFYEFEIKKHDVALEKDYEDNIPSVMIPRVRFQQVILNLLKNAIYATKEKKGNILIKTYKKGDNVFINVKDNGFGIDKKDFDSIFEPFYSTKSDKDGTGLGLSICKDIVEDYDGTISAKSSAKAGTTITIKFPAMSAKKAAL